MCIVKQCICGSQNHIFFPPNLQKQVFLPKQQNHVFLSKSQNQISPPYPLNLIFSSKQPNHFLSKSQIHVFGQNCNITFFRQNHKSCFLIKFTKLCFLAKTVKSYIWLKPQNMFSSKKNRKIKFLVTAAKSRFWGKTCFFRFRINFWFCSLIEKNLILWFWRKMWFCDFGGKTRFCSFSRGVCFDGKLIWRKNLILLVLTRKPYLRFGGFVDKEICG